MRKNSKYIQRHLSKVLLFGLWIIAIACEQKKPQVPNIIWFTTEDISPTLSMYGDSTAFTPNLDRLAAQSIIFNQAFATVGVCAPSRSSLITGMYPVSIGTHNMRTGKDVQGWGTRIYGGLSKAMDINGDSIPHYSVVTPDYVKCFTEYLRTAGYYCTNNKKTDYQFAAPVTAWDANGIQAHWKNRKRNQPFFAVFNHEVTHESRMWKNKDLEMTVNPASVPLPDYYPDTKTVRKDVARNYSNIEILDRQIGEKLSELENAGLLDNTIIFFFSDHGGPLPRGKREHYESGLRVPLMVHFPYQTKTKYNNDMISFVDFAPTMLSLVGIDIPDYLQGKPFLGNEKSDTQRKFVFGSGDRFDEYSDQIRSVISKGFIYVRNYHPELPAYKDVGYRKGIDMMNELLDLNAKDSLNEAQQYWFRKTKTEEEFYDRKQDPYNLKNLINNPNYKEEIETMRTALTIWQEEVKDRGGIAEKELFLEMWPNGIQPKTALPVIENKGGIISLTCDTKGASIAYIISPSGKPDLDSGWQLYHKPIELKQGEKLYAMATRIGFEDSKIIMKQ